MSFISHLSLKHALDDSARQGLLESLQAKNGYSLSEDIDEGLTYIHEDSRISWELITYTEEAVLAHGDLGQDLISGGTGGYGILRYPNDFDWVDQAEAMDFWTKVLPVTPRRILFTWTELCCVYIQLSNGMIVSLWLNWRGQEIEDFELIKTIFLDIAKVKLTPQLASP